mmetsp:Transcript_16505/g.56403  ORF Transcript_16505/g.56403 Transcript_16505/m.56403 type:complete len:223 (+) Transcript_16505:30-698(+)
MLQRSIPPSMPEFGRRETSIAITIRLPASDRPAGGVCVVRCAALCGLFRSRAHASLRAATPGRTLPSSNSSEAPPPVEMWDIFPANPASSTAATESPPPMMVMASASTFAMAVATAKVPFANFSNSKTPIGPFQTIVFDALTTSAKTCDVAGPTSRPSHPSGIESTLTTFASASAANLSATTTSVGSRSLTPLAFAFAIKLRAVSTRSSSTMEAPMLRPMAL